MLGQLLNSISSTSRRQVSRNQTLDSVTEDAHTQELLFPGSSVYHEHDGHAQLNRNSEIPAHVRGANPFGDLPGHEALDLEYPRDIRILIAQAAHGGVHPELLFDSKPPPVSESPKSPIARHSRNSSRNENVVGSFTGSSRVRPGGGVHSIPEDSLHKRTGSAFSTSGAIERARLHRSSISSAHSFILEPFQEGNREKDEIEKVALGCMFENATSSYKGTSNKVHVVPLTSKPYEGAYLSQSLGSDSPLSARPQLARKPSSLSQSHVPGDALATMETGMAFKEQSLASSSHSRRRTVLVTRTFSISWFDEETQEDQKTLGAAPSRLPAQSRDQNARHHDRRTSRQRPHRSPMYAVTIVLHLPVAHNDASPSLSRTGTFGRKSMRNDSSSHQSHVSLGSSFESDRRAAWSNEPFSALDSFASLAVSSDVDDRVDLIGKHWDIITRTMTTLQNLAQKKILELLEPLARNPRQLRLSAQALYSDVGVKKGAEECSIRLVRGMKIPRVRTGGHGRWPAWREEAKWLAKWAGGRDENLFFFILITAYLGTHTEWLNGLAPTWYKKRHREQQKLLNQATKMSIPSRTVIISSDKMAARRLIFLLAAFLPTNQQGRGDGSPMRPGTAASFRTYSQSPPGYFPVSRQQSLRRTINRRAKSGASHHRKAEPQTSSSTVDVVDDGTAASTIREDDSPDLTRVSTDTRSKPKFVGTDVEFADIKSEATASTITPSSIIVKPHFARQTSFGLGMKPSHSRTSSAASVNLMQPLQQMSSNASQNSKNWSFRNIFSGRRSSTSEFSEVLQTTDEGLGIVGLRPNISSNRLQQMVDEAHGLSPQEERPRKSTDGHFVMFAPSPELRERSPEREQPESLGNKSAPIQIPVKMSVNKEDGVIDVHLPFGGFDSPTIMSPGLSGGDQSGSSYAGSSFGYNSILSMSPKEPEHPLNVGGWLDKLHPDFTLQAVKPYSSVMDDVKSAMSAEPTPPLTEGLPERTSSVEKWLSICTTIVADTTSFTVKRISLRRHVRYVSSMPIQTLQTPGFFGPSRSQYGDPYREPAVVGSGSAIPITDITLKEELKEEVIGDIDRDFVNVLERVTGITGSPQKSSSLASSRASSVRGRPARVEEGEPAGDNARDCKKLIIGCLEAIILVEGQNRAKAKHLRTLHPDFKERVGHDTDSTLRDGVRQWLEDVEVKSAAIDEARRQAGNSKRPQSPPMTTTSTTTKKSPATTAVTIPRVTAAASQAEVVENSESLTPNAGRTPTPSRPYPET